MSTLPAADSAPRGLIRQPVGRSRRQVPHSTFAERVRFAALAPFNLILRAA